MDSEPESSTKEYSVSASEPVIRRSLGPATLSAHETCVGEISADYENKYCIEPALIGSSTIDLGDHHCDASTAWRTPSSSFWF